jgi:hypothetical protein
VVDPEAERDEASVDEVSAPGAQVALVEADDAGKLQRLVERCLLLWDQPQGDEELRRRAAQGRDLAALYLLEPTFGERTPGLPVEVGKVELTVLWATLGELADLDAAGRPPEARQRLAAVAAHLQQSRHSSSRALGHATGD